jgi:hypothetical protein
MTNLFILSMSPQGLLFISSILGYIDPGTGSIILQALVASVVGAAIAVKLFWHRILKFLGIRKSANTDLSEKPGDNKK